MHKLSAREAETIAEPGRHSDGGGLYLVIETGAHTRRQWIFLYRVRGTSKRRELGLGPAKGKAKDGLSLADARLKAADARKKLADGKDPAAERRAEKAASVTFGEFADALLKSIKSGFKGKKTHRDWKRDLEVRCKPIRSKALQEISATDVLNILLPMWLTINRTARETRSRIERVFMAARAKGLHSGENPAMWRGNLKELLPKARRTKRHHAAAPYKHVPDIVRALQERHKTANTDVNLAAEFIVLTAVRTGEARFMRVREVDFEEKLWTVPAERMKTEDDPEGSCFEVPLSERAVAILEAVVPNGAPPDAYVFAGQWSGNGEKPLGMNAVLHALKAVYPALHSSPAGWQIRPRGRAGHLSGFRTPRHRSRAARGRSMLAARSPAASPRNGRRRAFRKNRGCGQAARREAVSLSDRPLMPLRLRQTCGQ
ncbi:Phage integrase family protein [Bradyrhizobium erythrophlei]|uniref:Phage integrase family protein n=1 Tax=Bradyrhizobium erythrophlei TaxID=1437360 RepID=A0A1M7TIY8_9BRAD|nr:Phage integrase family protein [Bradyrhizobium erythrophlei]